MKERIIREKFNFKIPRRPIRKAAYACMLAYYLLGIAAGLLGYSAAAVVLGLVAGAGATIFIRYIGITYFMDIMMYCYQNKEPLEIRQEITKEVMDDEGEVHEETNVTVKESQTKEDIL